MKNNNIQNETFGEIKEISMSDLIKKEELPNFKSSSLSGYEISLVTKPNEIEDSKLLKGCYTMKLKKDKKNKNIVFDEDVVKINKSIANISVLNEQIDETKEIIKQMKMQKNRDNNKINALENFINILKNLRINEQKIIHNTKEGK